MIDDLTLEMNRVRQAEITQEILEVVGGRRGARLIKEKKWLKKTETEATATATQRRHGSSR